MLYQNYEALIKLFDPKVIGVDEEAVYMLGGNPKLFVSSMHHANELYGTWEAILEARKAGLDFRSVPVVNSVGFDLAYRAHNRIENNEDLPQILYEQLKGYKGQIVHPKIYPNWNKWDYGSKSNNSLVTNLEIFARESNFVLDIHNCPSDKYMLITEDSSSQLQQEVEDCILRMFEERGIDYASENYFSGYSTIRQGVYKPNKRETSLIAYAAKEDVPNLVLEVPVFEKVAGKNKARNKDELVEINKEIIRQILITLNCYQKV